MAKNKKPPAWTGELLGRMHNAGVTRQQLCDRLGMSKAYVSMVFNGGRTSSKMQGKLEAAFEEILKGE